MDCNTARMLATFFGRRGTELAPEDAAALDTHLASCPQCAAANVRDRHRSRSRSPGGPPCLHLVHQPLPGEAFAELGYCGTGNAREVSYAPVDKDRDMGA